MFFSLFKSVCEILHCLPPIKSSIKVQVHFSVFKAMATIINFHFDGDGFWGPLADGTHHVQMNQ